MSTKTPFLLPCNLPHSAIDTLQNAGNRLYIGTASNDRRTGCSCHTAVETSNPTPHNTMPLTTVDLWLAKLEETPGPVGHIRLYWQETAACGEKSFELTPGWLDANSATRHSADSQPTRRLIWWPWLRDYVLVIAEPPCSLWAGATLYWPACSGIPCCYHEVQHLKQGRINFTQFKEIRRINC